MLEMKKILLSEMKNASSELINRCDTDGKTIKSFEDMSRDISHIETQTHIHTHVHVHLICLKTYQMK